MRSKPTPKQLLTTLLVVVASATALGVFLTHRAADIKEQKLGQRVSEDETESAAKSASEKLENTKLARRRALREFPPEIDRMLKGITGWGYWVPGGVSIEDGQISMANSRCEGSEPTKHSYRSLDSIGALDDSLRGYATLFLILATPADKERVRKTDGGISVSVDQSHSRLSYRGEDLDAVFSVSDAARRTLGELQEIQRILKEYRTEIIGEGLLTE